MPQTTIEGWEITIREQRRQLLDLLEQSPSLRNEAELLFPKCWAEALAIVREDYPQIGVSRSLDRKHRSRCPTE
jgi:hypothetical protein